MAEHALLTPTQARRPSLVRLLAVLIIVLSMTGTGMAAFTLTERGVATRQLRPHVAAQSGLTSTHRPRPRPHR